MSFVLFVDPDFMVARIFNDFLKNFWISRLAFPFSGIAFTSIFRVPSSNFPEISVLGFPVFTFTEIYAGNVEGRKSIVGLEINVFWTGE